MALFAEKRMRDSLVMEGVSNMGSARIYGNSVFEMDVGCTSLWDRAWRTDGFYTYGSGRITPLKPCPAFLIRSVNSKNPYH